MAIIRLKAGRLRYQEIPLVDVDDDEDHGDGGGGHRATVHVPGPDQASTFPPVGTAAGV